MTFGEMIQQARRQRQWPQSELARRLGVSRQTVVALESDQHAPSFETAVRLADLLDLSLDQLASAHRLSTSVPTQMLWLDAVSPQVPIPIVWSLIQGVRVLVPISLLATPSPPDAVYNPVSGEVRPFPSARHPEDVILIGGCDPFVPWLSQIFHAVSPQHFLEGVWLSSTRALESWRAGLLHIAGTHLFDAERGVYNPDNWVSIDHLKIPYIAWEEGLATRPDHARLQRVAIRDPGSEAHALYVRRGPHDLKAEVFRTHQALLDAVALHPTWAGVGLGPQAVLMGLDFTPWVLEHYDLWIRASDAKSSWFPPFEQALRTKELARRLDAVPHLARKWRE
ncbi:helix-turn-helix domain-containing protein [Sulfobacillus harzensis]|uniref:Helix-turn-helix domain-containing protein n=1 Tax=Sulfobacillus harzensis TaxID=2729629 RepID=A0A7Y0Q2Z8_9FIRM|nr:helix-turn-helix domain-containing protein [Sulfobacillus harzensis]NMP21679.1 helix-turn-helix domain-containing protein [Sulfobacillus harzensis]